MCPNHSYRFSVANLAHRGKKVRLMLGLVGAIFTTGLAVILIVQGVHPLWLWMLALPAFASILCLLEAFTSTCVVLAVLGAWDMGCGTERVPDPRLDAALRSRAWKLVALAAIAGIGFALASTCCAVGRCKAERSYAKENFTEMERLSKSP
jgi:membrane-bound ClpP family serine protease